MWKCGLHSCSGCMQQLLFGFHRNGEISSLAGGLSRKTLLHFVCLSVCRFKLIVWQHIYHVNVLFWNQCCLDIISNVWVHFWKLAFITVPTSECSNLDFDLHFMCYLCVRQLLTMQWLVSKIAIYCCLLLQIWILISFKFLCVLVVDIVNVSCNGGLG